MQICKDVPNVNSNMESVRVAILSGCKVQAAMLQIADGFKHRSSLAPTAAYKRTS